MRDRRDKRTRDADKSDLVGMKNIELQMASTKDAFHRLRFVFVVMTIASTAILFTLWNATFSRDRTLAFGQKFEHKDPFMMSNKPCEILEYAGVIKKPLAPKDWFGTDQTKTETAVNTASASISKPETTPHEFGISQILDEWYGSRSIHVGLLGIHISVGDLPVIGSLALVIITVWFFYSEKRANKALVMLLRKVYTKYGSRSEVSEMVYREVLNSLLFTRTAEGEGALVGLSPRKVKPAGTTEKNASARKKKSFIDRVFTFLPFPPFTTINASARKNRKKKSFTDRVFTFLTFLPFTTIVAIVARDILALFMYSPTSGKNLRLGWILWLEMQCNFDKGETNSLIAGYSIVLLILFESVAILCAMYTFCLCKRSSAFARANRITLQQFNRKLTLAASQLRR